MLSRPINSGAKMAAAAQILGIKFLKDPRYYKLFISQVLYSPSCNPYLTYCQSQQSNSNKKYNLSSSIDFQSLKLTISYFLSNFSINRNIYWFFSFIVLHQNIFYCIQWVMQHQETCLRSASNFQNYVAQLRLVNKFVIPV